MSRMKGEFYMIVYKCGFPEWVEEPRPCDNPNEDPPVSCDSCFFGYEEEEDF